MPTQNTWNNAVINSAVTFNGGVTSIGTDVAANAINIGTGGAAKVITLGNVIGATAVNINTGTGGHAITTTNGVIGLISGTGAVNIGADAVAKTVTVGNTTGASVLALKYGTNGFSLASATGNIMLAQSTGEITYPLQPAFLAKTANIDSNVTGDGTNFIIGSGNALTEIYDNNSDFNVNGTFTAPVTGRYFLCVSILAQSITAVMTTTISIITTNRTYTYGNTASSLAGNNPFLFSTLADMTATDTATFQISVGGGAKVVDIFGDGGGPRTFVCGHLVC